MENKEYEEWFADFQKKEVDKFMESVEKTLERVKGRATNLLGWMITLSAAMGTLLFSTKSHYSSSILIMCIGFLLVAILCVRILYSTKWKNYDPYPSILVKIKNNHSNKNDMLKGISEYIEERIDFNIKQVIHLQKYIRCAWILSVATPTISLLFSYIIYKNLL